MAEIKEPKKLPVYEDVPEGGQYYRRRVAWNTGFDDQGKALPPAEGWQYVYARSYEGADGFTLRIGPWKNRVGEDMAPLIPHPESDPDEEPRMVRSQTTGGGRGDWIARDVETGELFVVRRQDFPRAFTRVGVKGLPESVRLALKKAGSPLEE